MMQAEEKQIDAGATFTAVTRTPSEWKTLSAAILTVVEDATFDVSSSGIEFRGMDPSHVGLVDVSWPSTAFERFECSKSNRFTVRMEDFAKLLKRAEAKDSVELSRNDSDSLRIKIERNYYRRDFELHLLSSDAKSQPLPKLTFATRFSLSVDTFAQIMNDVSTVSNHVSVTARKDCVVFTGKGDSGKAKAVIGTDGPLQELETIATNNDQTETSATYNVEYLLKIVKAVSTSVADNLKFEFSAKMPLRLEFSLGEGADRCRMHFYLAPRITD